MSKGMAIISGVLTATVSAIGGILLALNLQVIAGITDEAHFRNQLACVALLVFVIGAPLIGGIVGYILWPRSSTH